MKNLLIVLTLILGVSIFSSCSKEECETCAYNFAWVDAPTDWEADEAATTAMNTVNDAMNSSASGELCDDALTDAKDAFAALDATATSGEAMTDAEGNVIMPGWAITMDCTAVE